MKPALILFCTLFFISFSDILIAAERPPGIAPFAVRSNTFSNDIPNGKFAVKGFIRDINSKQPISNAVVTNSNTTITANSDSNGYFQMIFPISDSLIYCYAVGKKEIVFNPKISRNEFKNRHIMEVDFYLQESVEQIISFKPVVYAYNAADEFKLSIKPHGSFSFTYPKSNGDWMLKTNDDGTLYDLKTQKNYPYIFWEGPGKDLDFVTEKNTINAYLIKTDTCVKFLENVLSQIGLNAKESADFITFWGPRLIQKEYALIQFLNSEMYETKIATINVEPKAESMLRLYMYFMPLESVEIDFKINEPQFEKIERTGFTVVEWGGSVLWNSKTLSI